MNLSVCRRPEQSREWQDLFTDHTDVIQVNTRDSSDVYCSHFVGRFLGEQELINKEQSLYLRIVEVDEYFVQRSLWDNDYDVDEPTIMSPADVARFGQPDTVIVPRLSTWLLYGTFLHGRFTELERVKVFNGHCRFVTDVRVPGGGFHKMVIVDAVHPVTRVRSVYQIVYAQLGFKDNDAAVESLSVIYSSLVLFRVCNYVFVFVFVCNYVPLLVFANVFVCTLISASLRFLLRCTTTSVRGSRSTGPREEGRRTGSTI